jgi:hypothetical protein
MSAPRQGRESLSPSRQTGAQQQEPPSTGKTAAHDAEKEEEEKRKGVQGLESNPVGILERRGDSKNLDAKS